MNLNIIYSKKSQSSIFLCYGLVGDFENIIYYEYINYIAGKSIYKNYLFCLDYGSSDK